MAARDFRAAAALDPTATRPLEALGDVLYAQERFRRAAETYEARLRLDDRSAPIRYKLALARYRDGAVDTALAETRRALALDAQLADAYYLAALCLRDKGLSERCRRVASDSRSNRSPGLIAAREELADMLAAAGRYVEQLEQLQVLAGLDGRRPERQIAIGLAQARAGNVRPRRRHLVGRARLARRTSRPSTRRWAASGCSSPTTDMRPARGAGARRSRRWSAPHPR